MSLFSRLRGSGSSRPPGGPGAPADASTARVRTIRARVSGQVQGVGFRPHAYRLAGELEVRLDVLRLREVDELCERCVRTMRAAGCTTAICFRMVAPSFVITTSPEDV